MDIVIDATSLHPSTRLALAALEWLDGRISPKNILEIGCGNGILSLTSAHLWDASIFACDIAEQAITDSQNNLKTYGNGADITFFRSNGMKHPAISKNAPYHLIIGNLLAQWQVHMAKDIAACLPPNGHLLLSGILAWQAAGVLEAFELLNINKLEKFSEQEWECYILCHNIK